MSAREELDISREKFLHVLATSDNMFCKIKCACFALPSYYNHLGNRTKPVRKLFLDTGQQGG